jgi:hypothetical protein
MTLIKVFRDTGCYIQGQELDATEIEAAEDGVNTANSGMSTTTDSVSGAVQDSIEL